MKHRQLRLGGIDNYLLLALLRQSEGQYCVVVQSTETEFSVIYQDIEVVGINCGGYRGNQKKLA